MYRLFSFLLDRRVSLVGFGLFMMPIQLAAIFRVGAGVDDARRLAATGAYCLMWALIYFALRGNRPASAGVGAYMALQGLLYVLMLLGNLMSLLTGDLDVLLNFLMGVAFGPWFLVAGGGLLGSAFISWRTRQPLPDAARVEFPGE
jgi:hypothetical protein